MIISLITFIITAVAEWRIFTKMGKPGWAAFIPIYSAYVKFDALYGNGWKFLLLLIPFYNIYIAIKLCIDLAKGFNMGTGFAIGLLFLPFIFEMILAFGSAQFMDGKYDITDQDDLGKGINKIASSIGKDPRALEKLQELDDLHKRGVVTDEEFTQKKVELMKRI